MDGDCGGEREQERKGYVEGVCGRTEEEEEDGARRVWEGLKEGNGDCEGE